MPVVIIFTLLRQITWNLSIIETHRVTLWLNIIWIQTWNERISSLSIKIICILTKSAKFLKVIPFFWSSPVSINPLLLLYLSIINSHFMIYWILIIWIKTWNQRMSCLIIKIFWWSAKSSKFFKVIPFFRSSSVSIYPPFLFILSIYLSIIYSHFVCNWVFIFWI